MPLLIGLPLAAAMLAGCLWLAYLAAIRLTSAAHDDDSAGSPRAAAEPARVSASERLGATALVALWLQVVVFTALAATHLFRLVVAAPLWIGGALAAYRLLGGRQAAALLAGDLAAARAALVALLRSPLRAALFIAGASLLGVRLVRDLVSPPLAWDAFLYHLYKPATWVQYGGFIDNKAPDNWGYLNYYPHAGDIPWAWAMLPVRGDALIAPAGLLVWGACVLGAYAAARAFGARQVPAGLCALAVGFIPGAANISTSSYADNFVLAGFLLGAAAAVRLAKVPSVGHAALAGAAFGLVASGKLSGLPALALSLAFVCLLLVRGSGSALAITKRARLKAVAVAAAAATVVAIPGYLRAYLATGSPFYPLTITLGNKTLFAGNEELALLYSGKLLDLSHDEDSLATLFNALVIPAGFSHHEHLGFGIGSIYLSALGLAGAWQALRRRETREPAIFLAIAAAAPLIALMSGGFLAHRTMWRFSIGRLFTPAPALLAVLGARTDSRASRALWGLAIFVNLISCIPMGFSPIAVEGMFRLVPALAVAVAAGAGFHYLVARRLGHRRLGAAAAVLLPCLVIALPLQRIRAELRYPIFATHASKTPSFQMHTLQANYASSWTIWRHFDDGPPHRLAVIAGWDGVGHNSYRYPLMGSRLQNTIDYIPVSADGSIIDYREAARINDTADFDSWVRRLVEKRIDYVVSLNPAPIEQYWMEAHGELFERVAWSPEMYNVAFRFKREKVAP